jgi:Cupin domain
VVAGTLDVRIGDREVELRPGQTAAAPYGTLHSLRNRSDAPVTFQVELLPGHPGFEQAIQIAYGLAADGLVRDNGLPRRLSDLAVVVQLGETRFSGPVAVLQPLFGLLARRADRNGVQRRLVERYCRIGCPAPVAVTARARARSAARDGR